MTGQLHLVACGSAEFDTSMLIEKALQGTPGNEPSFAVIHLDDARLLLAGATSADAALLLVDARTGILPKTRHHALLLNLAGLSEVLVLVDRMDLIGYSESRFRAIEREYLDFALRLGSPEATIIPVCASRGENVTIDSPRMSWHTGPTLLDRLQGIEANQARSARLPFRMPVQNVHPVHPDACEVSGTVVSGVARPGDAVRSQSTGRMCKIVHIGSSRGALPQADPGQSVTLRLDGVSDVPVGDLLTQADAPAGVADQFEATVIWMGEQPMLGGRPYQMHIGRRTVLATPAAPKYRIDPETLEHFAARKLERDEIGVCNLSLDQQVAFDPFRENRETGRFDLVDRLSNESVGAGLLHFALRRADNIQVQAVDVGRDARARLKGQSPCVVWLTGLSGAGKSTIANLLDRKLHAMGRHTYLMDGDNVRHGLNRDLGFTAADRVENVRRVAEVAKLMADAGLIVIVALISPFRSERQMARELMKPGEFVEVFVDAPLHVAEQRDTKGLYRKARQGELKNFTGIDSPYEAPTEPEVHVETSAAAPDACVQMVLEYVVRAGTG